MASLIWTNSAKNDLKEIYEYIAADSRYYANSFIEKIQETAKKLKVFPRIGRIVPEYNLDVLRELIYRNYRIIYKISEEKIYIVSIFHAARDFIKSNKKIDF